MKSKSSKFKNVPSSEEIYAHIFGPTWRIRQYQAFVGHISKKNILFSGYVYQINTIYRYCFYLLLRTSSHQNAPLWTDCWKKTFSMNLLALCMFQQTVNVVNRLSCIGKVTSFTFLWICTLIASSDKIFPHFQHIHQFIEQLLCQHQGCFLSSSKATNLFPHTRQWFIFTNRPHRNSLSNGNLSVSVFSITPFKTSSLSNIYFTISHFIKQSFREPRIRT